MEERSKLTKILLQVDLKVEQLLHDVESSLKLSKTDTIGMCLPTISVPSFDTNIQNHTSFRKQFVVAVRNKDSLQDVEKLVYLKDAVKDSPAS